MTSWDDLVGDGHARRDVDLAPLTTYKLGGPADLFVEVGEPALLTRVGEALAAEPRPVLVLGRGSNLLVADSGFGGVVLRLVIAAVGPGGGFGRARPSGVVRWGTRVSRWGGPSECRLLRF